MENISRQITFLAVVIALSGCGPGSDSNSAGPVVGSGNVPRFEPIPERLVTIGFSGLMECQADFRFIDSHGTTWHSVKGTKTDGASIPQFFLSLIGGRFAPEYRAAALVHDAYCQEINEDGPYFRTLSWKKVHSMFYDALLENRRMVAEQTGKPVNDLFGDIEAKLMFAAVWIRGPRWGEDEIQTPPAATDALQKEEFQKCRGWIEKMNPSVDEIVTWMSTREPDLRNGVSPPIDW
jgi:hypothetical protein